MKNIVVDRYLPLLFCGGSVGTGIGKMSVLSALIFLRNFIKIHSWCYPIFLWLSQRNGCLFLIHTKVPYGLAVILDVNYWSQNTVIGALERFVKVLLKHKGESNWMVPGNSEESWNSRREEQNTGTAVFCLVWKAFLHWLECWCHWLLQSKSHQWVEISLRIGTSSNSATHT